MVAWVLPLRHLAKKAQCLVSDQTPKLLYMLDLWQAKVYFPGDIQLPEMLLFPRVNILIPRVNLTSIGVCQSPSPARDVFSSANNLRLDATRTTEINPCLQFFGHHRWV